jgi:cytochrome P450
MGLPEEELDNFLEMKNGIIRPPVNPADLAASRAYRTQVGKRIYAYFENLIDERTQSPRDDIMTHLVTTEVEGRKLTREEILDICFLFLLGGLDTVTASLGCSIAFLASHPEHRAKLAGDPSLTDGAVEELLRWETPVMMLPRLLKESVTMAGMELQAGSLVTLLIGAANVDEKEFAGSDTVDFERERNRHLSFGGGVHRCLGSHFARMELRVALEEWHRRIPDYAIKPGETPRYSPGIREVQYLPLVWPSPAA